MNRFQEHGITDFWFSTIYRDNAWMEKFFDDYPAESNEPQILQFSSISGALLVLFGSHMLSTTIFACELMVKWFKVDVKRNFAF